MKFLKKNYPYILLGLSVLILLWKSFYGFCWSDESFYLSVTNRFFQGDMPIRDEWQPTQLENVLNVPLYALYIAITGSNDGIYLFFRLVYVILEGIAAFSIFNLLKKSVSKFSAFIASMFMLYYSHLNIATLSYYTISLLSFLVVCVIIYSYRDTKSRLSLVIAGILFAFCVVSVPPMAAGYVFLVVTAVICYLGTKFLPFRKDIKDAVKNAEMMKIFLFTLIGIAVTALIFFIYMFKGMTIKELIDSLGYVFTDEEHPFSLEYPARKFFYCVRDVFGRGAIIGLWLIIASFVYGCLIRDGLIPYIIRKRQDEKPDEESKPDIFEENCKKADFVICTCFLLAELLLLIICWPKTIPHTGYIQSALAMTTIPVFFLCPKRDWRKGICFVAAGLFFSLVYAYASNNFLYILAMGHSVTCFGGILCIEDYAKALKENIDESKLKSAGYKTFKIVTTVILLCALIQTMSLRMWNVFRDAPIPQMTAKITCGPAKGIYSHPDHEKQYTEVYDTIKEYCQAEKEGDTIFITRLLPWGYLCTDARSASPTTWRTPFNSKRLEPYWNTHPDRQADKILVLKEEYGSYYACGDVEDDFNPNLNEMGGFLQDYIDANDFSVREVPCGWVYIKQN